MSFILDALKRAERERRLERPPDLTAVYEENHLPRRGIRPWFWLSGVFLVGAIVVSLILWPQDPDPDVPTMPKKASIERSLSDTTPARKGAAPPSPPLKKSSASKPPKPSSNQTSSTQPAPARLPETPAAQAPKRIAETEVKDLTETGSKLTGKTLDVSPQPMDKSISKSPNPPIQAIGETEPVEPAAPQTETDPERGNEMDDKTMLDESPSPPAPLLADPKTEASPGKPTSIPLLTELPFDVREKLGKVQINVHSYSENPNERLVFINMQSLKVEDRIGENGPILKEITPDGVIIDYGEGRARVQVGR